MNVSPCATSRPAALTSLEIGDRGRQILPLGEVELARLFQRVGKIGAGDREHDHLGLRRLGGDEKRAEIGGVERRAQASDDSSATLGDRVARDGLEGGAEGVVGGDEEEAVELLLDGEAASARPRSTNCRRSTGFRSASRPCR